MTRISTAHYLLILTLVWGITLSARSGDKITSPFVGEWCNKDFNTSGITRVHILQKGTNLIVHMWGRCHPTECDWGEVNAVIPEPGKPLLLTWTKSFKIETQTLKVLADGSLELQGHAHFVDNSGRTDYDSKYIFTKGLTHNWSDPPKR